MTAAVRQSVGDGIEWASNASYQDRVAHLQTGVGPNGDIKLEVGTTVFADGDRDTLRGDKAQDWILADAEDRITDKKGGGSDKGKGRGKGRGK